MTDSDDSFFTELDRACRDKRTRVIAGMDPRLHRMPPFLLEAEFDPDRPYRSAAACFRRFGERVIEAVAEPAAAVKFQLAFFERIGPAGLECLQHLLEYARKQDLLTVCDAKRGDIGSTARAYADAFLGKQDLQEFPVEAPWRCGALTVNPWLGLESLDPFVEKATESGSALYLLLHTSNPGAVELQEQELASAEPLYLELAEAIETKNRELAGSGWGPLGAVVGATYPEQLTELRERMPSTHFLIPGYGAQGGGAEDIVGGFDEDGLGAVVNSSRGIIFHWDSEEWQTGEGDPEGRKFAEAAHASAEAMRREINQALGTE